jgi:hypothetical protein
MSMPSTLSVLLDGLIDFAGLFPPAQLEMKPMVQAYHRAGIDARGWMLGRVIVPATRLAEFEAAAAQLLPDEEEADPWCLSVLTRPCGSEELAEDLAAIEAFNTIHSTPEGGRAIIDVIELKGESVKSIDETLDQLPDELFPFVEIPASSDVRGAMAVLAGSEAGAKLRTGGVTPDLYPSVDEIARFVVAAAGSGVPFKATAGLHHPLANDNLVVPARQHGFLSVFLSACIARCHELDANSLAELLQLSDPDEFCFGDDQASLGEYTISRDDIEESRLGFAISFGSCSVQEPWDDLTSLGLLEPESTEIDS